MNATQPDTTVLGLAHNLFGFKLNQSEFMNRLQNSKDREILENTALRVYLADRVRYGLQMKLAPFHADTYLQHLLVRQINALELHLLCTCIDALSGGDFLAFHDWLKMGQAGKKTGHGLNEDHGRIEQILNAPGDNLRDPDAFRHMAGQLYDDVYVPRFGNQSSFVRFFLGLPHSVQLVLADVYTISADLDDKQNELKVWPRVQEEWQAASIEHKMRAIGKYVYLNLRNPYTHQARAIPPRTMPMRTWKEVLGVDFGAGFNEKSAFDWINDVVPAGKYHKIRRFSAGPGEDESQVLYLVVVMAYLARLGYETDRDYVRAFRGYQSRRDRMHRALAEMHDVSEILKYYKREDDSYPHIPWLPEFPTEDVIKLRPHLSVGTPLEGGIDAKLQEYLVHLQRLNEPIRVFNEARFPNGQDMSDLEERQRIEQDRPNAYRTVNEMADLDTVNQFLCSSTYRWLPFLADRMIW